MQRRLARYWWLAACFAIACCSASALGAGIEDMTSEDRARLARLKVYEGDPFAAHSYTILGTVKGRSCARGGEATLQDAVGILSIQAAAMGADAVINVVSREGGVDWLHNCWATVTAVGDAVKLNSNAIVTEDSQGPPSANVQVVSGTGWMVRPGVIVTNWHVVEGKTDVQAICVQGEASSLRVVQKDLVNDLAVLVADSLGCLSNCLPLASEDAALGSAVFTVGFPHPDVMGSAPKLTSGIVSALSGLQDDPRFYQVSVPLQAGNSGGPLVNSRGEVVGIVTAKLNATAMQAYSGDLTEGVSYAIRIDYLRPLIRAWSAQGGVCKATPPSVPSVEHAAPAVLRGIVMIIAK